MVACWFGGVTYKVPAPDEPLIHTHCTHIGSRPAQEDRLTIVDDGWSVDPDGTPSDSANWPRCRFYAVFDGHLGDSAAEAASVLLWSHLQPSLIALQRRPPSGDASEGEAPSADELEAAMREAFRATEQQLLEQVHESGSTAVCVLLLGDRLCVAHVGDSRAVLCHAERPVRLTEDHKPNQPEESARIVAAGGHVTTPYARGTENVPRLNGLLSVSRALGNAPIKRSREGGSSGAALSAEPELKVLLHPLTSLRPLTLLHPLILLQGADDERVRRLRAARERWTVGRLLRPSGDHHTYYGYSYYGHT